MYRIEKRFTLPIGHRLSKHKGRCFSIHGHNFTILVGIKARELNENDMLIDFSDLKNLVNEILDGLDHCLLLNQDADKAIADQLSQLGMRTMLIGSDPTAEHISERLYRLLRHNLSQQYPEIMMDYVTVFENENSKATYSEE